MNFSVAFHTLGCKLNQLETESIARAFAEEGFRVVGWQEPADIYVVNTCTVTSKAEQKARREIRKALRERPHACLIATGCYAQLDPASIAAIADELEPALGRIEAGRLAVVSLDLKAALLDLPAHLAASACTSADLPRAIAAWSAGEGASPSAAAADRFRFDADDFSFHSRASLKIQDGCDASCAYCRVRLARGRSVSLASGEALSRLRRLEAAGYAEAVLTGINLNRYRDGDLRFSGLLRYLLDGTERIALRISSTEPEGVDDEFAEVASHPRVRPHFHLSVQSLSDPVLARMRRGYRAADVLRAADLLRGAKKDPFLACDMIAGFPGETDADFSATLDLCRRIGFAWIHAFTFSPRPGTEAASMDGKVPERVAVERTAALNALAKEGKAAYAARQAGSEVEAVVETVPGNRSRGCVALSGNYLKLAVGNAPSELRPGDALRCRVRDGIDPDGWPLSEIDAEAEFLEILRKKS